MAKFSSNRFWFLLGLCTAYAATVVIVEPPTAHAKKRRSKKRRRTKSSRSSEQDAQTRRNIKREAGLGKKKQYEFDDEFSKTKDLKPADGKDKKGPSLSLEDLSDARVEELMDEKLDEEIDIANQLVELESGCSEASPIRFRLADLHWEKSKRKFFEANDFDVSESMRARANREMKEFQTTAISNYQKIVDDCPDYEGYAETLFYLGKSLTELERYKEGSENFQRVIREFPDSPWVANAWFMVGEYFFNAAQDANKALRAYKKAAEYRDSGIYGFAVYKQGWCYINNTDFDLAMERFREVVRISDNPTSPSERAGRLSLRKEALKDYVRAFAQIADAQIALKDFLKLGGRSDLPWMMERLGNWYINQGAHKALIKVYRDLIGYDEGSTRLPVYQGRIVDAASRLNDKKATVTQAKILTRYFKKVRQVVATGKLDEQRLETAKKDLREADEIAENTLRRLALGYHQEARKLRGSAQDRTLRIAHDIYKHYLEVFPEPRATADVNYVFLMRFYYAEVLFRLERFREAADNYDQVVAMNYDENNEREVKLRLAAAEESVRAYDELVQDLDRKNPPKIGGSGPKPIPAIKQKLINACKRYISIVGSKGENIVEIRYKVARTYYTYNHFDDAAPAFEDIVKNHPESSVACYAANLSLDIYNGKKNYLALREASGAFRKSERLACEPEDRERFAKIEQQSAFKLIKTEYEEPKRYFKAATEYMKFYREFHKSKHVSELADDALYNAAVNFDLSNRLEKANEVRRFLVEKIPDSPLVPETLYNIAQSYERVVDFQQAAKYLEQFAERYPEDERSKNALFNAGLYRSTLGDYAGSKKTRQRYLRNYESADDAHTVSFSICETLEREAASLEASEGKLTKKAVSKWTEAHDCFFDFIKNREYARAYPDLLCHAQFRRGEIMRLKTKYQKGSTEQRTYLKKNWPKWKKRGLKKVARCGEAMAQIYFQELQNDYRKTYAPMKISSVLPTKRGQRRFKASVAAKTKKREGLIGGFKNVVSIGVPEWALASLYYIGDAYRESIDALLAAPIPTKIESYKLSEEDKENLRASLRKEAKPIEALAIDAFRLCVDKANELGTYNKWSERALERLQDFSPEEYAPVVERVPEVNIAVELKVVKNHVVAQDGTTFREVTLSESKSEAPKPDEAAAAKGDG